MKGLMILFRRELALAWAGGGGPLLACGFFLCLTVLVPLAAGGDPAGLKPVAGGIAWLALALSSILSLERLFERDFEDGALDLLTNGPAPLELVFIVKAMTQWLATGLPLALTAPVAMARLISLWPMPIWGFWRSRLRAARCLATIRASGFRFRVAERPIT